MDAAAEQEVIKNIEEYGHDFTPEQFAHAKKAEKPVMIGKVDCVLHGELCKQQTIRAYPTLRFFVDGEHVLDYRGHRTVVEMADWLVQQESRHKADLDHNPKSVEKAAEAARRRMDVSSEEREWTDQIRNRHHRHQVWREDEHPGCQLAGHLMVDRVPGNFHVQARSASHDLVPHMTNVSHIVNQLSIGEPIVQRMIDTFQIQVPEDVPPKLTPMNGNVYVTQELHEAYHHYLKVITTKVDGNFFWGRSMKRQLKAYQLIQNSQLSYYRNDIVPEAKFIYDLSPISVHYQKRGRHWYDYLTSVIDRKSVV